MKYFAGRDWDGYVKSCPSRGTWIEIKHFWYNELHPLVVPLAGHVD